MLNTKKLINSSSITKILKRNFYEAPKAKENFSKMNIRKKLFDFSTKTLKKNKDEIIFDKLNIKNNKILVFKSNYSKWFIILSQLGIICASSFLIYQSIFKRKNKFIKIILFSISLGLLWTLIKSPKAKIWKNIKLIELDKDLSKADVTLMNSKKLNFFVKDFYLVDQQLQKSNKQKMLFDDIVIGIKGKSYSIPMKNALIPDDDLFCTVLRGYKINILTPDMKI
jgi:hypothetical protein